MTIKAVVFWAFARVFACQLASFSLSLSLCPFLSRSHTHLRWVCMWQVPHAIGSLSLFLSLFLFFFLSFSLSFSLSLSLSPVCARVVCVCVCVLVVNCHSCSTHDKHAPLHASCPKISYIHCERTPHLQCICLSITAFHKRLFDYSFISDNQNGVASSDCTVGVWFNGSHPEQQRRQISIFLDFHENTLCKIWRQERCTCRSIM